MKTALLLAVRYLVVVSMTLWLGGFTFYAAFVIPILHDTMGGYEAGLVTGEVTNPLNVVGGVTVFLWWILVACERSTRGKIAKTRLVLLIATTAILIGLVALHPIMDTRLETGPLRSFYPLHAIYLNASTAQWGINLALIATTLFIWRMRDMQIDQICTDSPIPCPAASMTASE